MSDLASMSMSELIARHNELASMPVTEFKNLKAARTAVANLENKMTDTTTEVVAGEAPAVDKQKYNSSGKRGPNQGVGAFAKEQIVEGKNNAEVLAMVKEKFPEAKTTTGCIAFYRTALSKGPAKPDPEALEAKAAALLAQAAAAREAAAVPA